MISVVICSRSRDIPSSLRFNIEETIGIVYEIICVDNSQSQYSIFEAYNIGVKKSRYPFICFLHDDVKLHTIGWGRVIVRHFENETVGMIGVAGPRYMSQVPGIWWGLSVHNEDIGAICQHNIDTDRRDNSKSHKTHIQPVSEEKIEVVALDGLFFCIRKTLFESISFDENYYEGFHFYDLDISLQVRSLGYKNYCVYDIVIEHISVSNINKEWVVGARLFFDKWKKELPIILYDVSKKDRKSLEFGNYKIMVRLLKSNGFGVFSFFRIKEIISVFSCCLMSIIKNRIKV